MGVVYRARDLTLDRDVALKFLPSHLRSDGAARDRLIREARAASALDHPHVAGVYEVGETAEGRLFIAMAYYRGETLQAKGARGPLPVADVVRYVTQAASGIAHAHRAGVVHRDVKPANLIVTEDDQVKVLDFGVATTAGGAGAADGVTVGSAPYMSPEQVQGRPTDARTDVWGLGATLYELLAGAPPFDGAFTTAVFYSVLHAEPRPVREVRPEVPSGLAEVVARCLQKEPSDRYPDVGAVLDALRPFQPTAAPTTTPERIRLRYRRLPLVGQVALAVAAIAAGVAMAWGLFRTGGPEEQHLAVLPFRTVGGGTEAHVLSAGLLETVTNRLGQLEQFDGSLWVVPASEVQQGMSASDARDQFGATLAVDGTVQIEGDRVRLLLNLIDTRTRRLVASGQVDAEAGSPMAVQDRAVLELAQMLQVEVLPRVRELLATGGTDDDGANTLYLRGRGVLRDHQSLADVERAAGLFRQAVGRDPDFALAHAALGAALWQVYGYTSDPAQADAAVVHVRRALALDPNSAPGHVALAVLHAGRDEYGRALESLDRALALDPTNAEAVRRRAGVLRDQGRTDEAEAAYTRAITLKPNDWQGYNGLGVFYYRQGRLDEAIATYKGALTVAPSNLKVLSNMGAAVWESGRLDEAVAVFERILHVDPDHPTATLNLATALFYRGEYARAARLYARERARYPDVPDLSLYLAHAQWWAPGQRGRARNSYRAALDAAHQQLSLARSADVLGVLAVAHAQLGARDSARLYLGEWVGLQGPDEVDPVDAFAVGGVYEMLGERDDARAWIQSALDRGHGAVELQHSPWLRALREELPALQ